MTREKKRQILENATDLAFDALAKVTSGDMHTEAVRQLLDNLSSLQWMTDSYDRPDAVGAEIVPMIPAEPEPVKPVEPAPAPKPEPAKAPEVTGVDEPQYKMADVRAALAKARGKGVNVSEIISSFGVSTFPELDASQYPAVMEKLKAAGA